MMLLGVDPIIAVLAIPLVAAALLALMPGYRITARPQRAGDLAHLPRCALAAVRPPEAGRYLLVDDLNNVFIVLTTFIGFTTSAFRRATSDTSWKPAA
jgi:hydrogenase-4 component F